MPQTENNSSFNELLQTVLLISSAPVEFTGAIYYLPLVSIDDLTEMNAVVVNWQIIEGTTQNFLTRVSQAKLTNISGLSGKVLPPYQNGHSILLLTTNPGGQYLAYGNLDKGYLILE